MTYQVSEQFNKTLPHTYESDND